MNNYKIKGNIVEITLNNGKVVKCDKKWVDNSMEKLDLSFEDTITMWLEDSEYLQNEEQNKLNNEAKKATKNFVTSQPKKTQKERVKKDNPDKECIISNIAQYLETINVQNVIIENKSKLITFTYNNKEFKLDLVEKRKPKDK